MRKSPSNTPSILIDGLAATSDLQRQLIANPDTVPAKTPDCLLANHNGNRRVPRVPLSDFSGSSKFRED